MQSQLGTDDLKTAVKAATHGRIDTLFMPLGVQYWGRYESQNNQIILEKEPNLQNKDLLDFAAIQTILNSGQVYAVRPKEIRAKGELAAILRYAI